MQQILVLIEENNFILNNTFHVLCYVGTIAVYSFCQGSPLLVSSTLKFGEGAGHGMLLECEITLWKGLRTTSVLHLAVCAVALSCWKKQFVGVNTKRLQLWKQEVSQHGCIALNSKSNVFIIIIFQRKMVQPSKQFYSTQCCHFRRMQWLFVQFCRIHWCPVAHIWFIHETRYVQMNIIH